MGIQCDAVRAGQEVRPGTNAREPIVYPDVGAISITVTSDSTYHVVRFEIAKIEGVKLVMPRRPEKKLPYKLVNVDRPMVVRSASFIMLNIGTMSLYSGCEMNSVKTRMYSSARSAFAIPMTPLRKLTCPDFPEWL